MMLQSYLGVALLISFAWIALIFVYLVISHRQKGLEEELHELESLLESKTNGQEGS